MPTPTQLLLTYPHHPPPQLLQPSVSLTFLRVANTMSHPLYNPYAPGNQSSTQGQYGLSSIPIERDPRMASSCLGPGSSFNSPGASSGSPAISGGMLPSMNYRPEQSRAIIDENIERSIDVHISRAREEVRLLGKPMHQPIDQGNRFTSTQRNEFLSSGPGMVSYTMSSTSVSQHRQSGVESGSNSLDWSSNYNRPTADNPSQLYSSASSDYARGCDGRCNASSEREHEKQTIPDKPAATTESSGLMYTSESASNILQQFGLEKEDLEDLISYPEDQITPANLPFILQKIRIKKTKRASTAVQSKSCHNPQPTRNVSGMDSHSLSSSGGAGTHQKEMSSAVFQQSKVIDYGHTGKYTGVVGDEIGKTGSSKANSGGSGSRLQMDTYDSSRHIREPLQKNTTEVKSSALGSSRDQESSVSSISSWYSPIMSTVASPSNDQTKQLHTQPKQTFQTILSSFSLQKKDVRVLKSEAPKPLPLKEPVPVQQSAKSQPPPTLPLYPGVHPRKRGLVLFDSNDAIGTKDQSQTQGHRSTFAEMKKQQTQKQPGSQTEQAMWPSGFSAATSVPSLCNKELTCMKDRISHQNTSLPLESCKLPQKQYPEGDGAIETRPSSVGKDAKLSPSTSLQTYEQCHQEVRQRNRSPLHSSSPHRRHGSEGKREKRSSRSSSLQSSGYTHRSWSRSRSPWYERPTSFRYRSRSRSPERRSSPRRRDEKWSSPRRRGNRRSTPRRSRERRSSPRSSHERHSSPRSSRMRRSSSSSSPKRQSSPRRRSSSSSSPKRRSSPRRRSSSRKSREQQSSPSSCSERGSSPRRSRERRSFPRKRHKRRWPPTSSHQRQSPQPKGLISAESLAEKLLESTALQSLSNQADLEAVVKILAPAVLAELAKKEPSSPSNASSSSISSTAKKKVLPKKVSKTNLSLQQGEICIEMADSSVVTKVVEKYNTRSPDSLNRTKACLKSLKPRLQDSSDITLNFEPDGIKAEPIVSVEEVGDEVGDTSPKPHSSSSSRHSPRAKRERQSSGVSSVGKRTSRYLKDSKSSDSSSFSSPKSAKGLSSSSYVSLKKFKGSSEPTKSPKEAKTREDETANDEPLIRTRSTRGKRERATRKDTSDEKTIKEDTAMKIRHNPARESQEQNKERTPKKEERAPLKGSTPSKKSDDDDVKEEIDWDAIYEVFDSVEDELVKGDRPATRRKGKRGRPEKDVKTTIKDTSKEGETEASDKVADEEEATCQNLDSVEDEMVNDQASTGQSDEKDSNNNDETTRKSGSLAGAPKKDEKKLNKEAPPEKEDTETCGSTVVEVGTEERVTLNEVGADEAGEERAPESQELDEEIMEGELQALVTLDKFIEEEEEEHEGEAKQSTLETRPPSHQDESEDFLNSETLVTLDEAGNDKDEKPEEEHTEKTSCTVQHNADTVFEESLDEVAAVKEEEEPEAVKTRRRGRCKKRSRWTPVKKSTRGKAVTAIDKREEELEPASADVLPPTPLDVSSSLDKGLSMSSTDRQPETQKAEVDAASSADMEAASAGQELQPEHPENQTLEGCVEEGEQEKKEGGSRADIKVLSKVRREPVGRSQSPFVTTAVKLPSFEQQTSRHHSASSPLPAAPGEPEVSQYANKREKKRKNDQIQAPSATSTKVTRDTQTEREGPDETPTLAPVLDPTPQTSEGVEEPAFKIYQCGLVQGKWKNTKIHPRATGNPEMWKYFTHVRRGRFQHHWLVPPTQKNVDYFIQNSTHVKTVNSDLPANDGIWISVNKHWYVFTETDNMFLILTDSNRVPVVIILDQNKI